MSKSCLHHCNFIICDGSKDKHHNFRWTSLVNKNPQRKGTLVPPCAGCCGRLRRSAGWTPPRRATCARAGPAASSSPCAACAACSSRHPTPAARTGSKLRDSWIVNKVIALCLILLNNFNLYIGGPGGLWQVELSQLTCSVCVQGWLKTLMLQLEPTSPSQQTPLVTRSKL